MPNNVNNELEFEKLIDSMENRQLLKFVARQNYETCIRCEQHNKRISMLENDNRKVSGIIGGISGTCTAIIVGIINYFVGAK